jgi:hypothetical protein
MSSKEQLLNIITDALTQHDNKLRTEAELKILQYRDNNSTEFFLNCADILAD